MQIVIIVPCYNEEDTLPYFYNEWLKTWEMISSSKGVSYTYKIIFVDDGSRDNTLSKIKELNQEDPNIVYISLSRNFGKEAAVYAGLEAAVNIYGGGVYSGDGCRLSRSTIAFAPNAVLY